MADESPLIPRPTREQWRERRAWKREMRRARNPLRLSLRSLAFTFALAILAAMGIIALALSLRSEPTSAPNEAAIVLSAVEPSSLDAPALASIAPATQVILEANAGAGMALTGPPVATVIITETPAPLAVGLTAVVVGVGNDELNVRNLPNRSGSEVLFRAAGGTELELIGGPTEADGFVWWRVRDPQFQVEGWAAARYLQTIST